VCHTDEKKGLSAATFHKKEKCIFQSQVVGSNPGHWIWLMTFLLHNTEQNQNSCTVFTGLYPWHSKHYVLSSQRIYHWQLLRNSQVITLARRADSYVPLWTHKMMLRDWPYLNNQWVNTKIDSTYNIKTLYLHPVMMARYENDLTILLPTSRLQHEMLSKTKQYGWILSQRIS
jgi:hypothetical protein